MAKKRSAIKDKDVQALADAVTRAIHHAPESLLRHFETGRRDYACRRLALRVLTQLAGDGWTGKDADALLLAIEAGIGHMCDNILTSLSDARRCNGRLLDGIGEMFGELIFTAMDQNRSRLVRNWNLQTLEMGDGGPSERGAQPDNHQQGADHLPPRRPRSAIVR